MSEYVPGDHYSEYGLILPRSDCILVCFCYFTVINNLYVLTTASCFRLYSLMKQNQWEYYVESYHMLRFTSKGEYGSGYLISAMSIYPYIKEIPRPESTIPIWNYYKDDFSIFRLDRRLPISENIYLTKLPSEFIDDDLENVIENLENENSVTHVWTHTEYFGKDVQLVPLTGYLVTREMCMKLNNCTEYSKERIECYLLQPDFGFRCVYFEEIPKTFCRNDTSSSPVIVDGVVWGLITHCYGNTKYYVSLEKSYSFLFDYIANKTLFSKLNYITNSSICLGAVLLLILLVIFCGFVLVKNAKKKVVEEELKNTKEPIIKQNIVENQQAPTCTVS